MKLSYKFLNTNQFILILAINLLLFSCGTYQSAYNNDGIYGSDTSEQIEEKIIIVDENGYKEYNNNYFTNELERLEDLDEDAVFTDVDSYNSPDRAYEEDNLNYNTNPSWGSNGNNDVVVNVNLNSNPYWNDFGQGFNNFGFNNWGYRNRWGWNNGMGFNNGWGWNNGFNNWGFNNWAHNPFWHPYHNNVAFGWGMYGNYNQGFGNFYGYNRFNRNGRYGRRASYNNFYTRDNINARGTATVSRRRVNATRLSSSASRRGNTSTTAINRRFSSIINRASGDANTGRNTSTRNSSSIRSSTNRTAPTRSSSSTRRSATRSEPSRGSSSTRRASNGNASSRNSGSSSNSSPRSSRNSSSRSSSTRSTPSRSSSSSRGSSSSSRRGNN